MATLSLFYISDILHSLWYLILPKRCILLLLIPSYLQNFRSHLHNSDFFLPIKSQQEHSRIAFWQQLLHPAVWNILISRSIWEKCFHLETPAPTTQLISTTSNTIKQEESPTCILPQLQPPGPKRWFHRLVINIPGKGAASGNNYWIKYGY